jgi:hypothetical protein
MNNILNKIAQMERNAEEIQLASHKVELGLVEDLAKLLTRMKAIDGALMKSTQKAVNALGDFVKVKNQLNDGYVQATMDAEDAQEDIKLAVALIEKIAKQAKELGLNPNDVKGTQEVVKITANLEDTIAILERNESDIKKIISI